MGKEMKDRLKEKMHFVKKVATTEEQKLKKEKEKTGKLKIYCKLRDRIFEKRMKGELDEEMLLLTASLLEKNPDIYTFWNIRRQVINLLSMKLSEESEEENTNRKDRIFRSELLLTEASLKANSKSYCAWFYRLWCFKQLSNPDIAEELAACEKFLKLDGRNFHCWDYRREIARFGSHSAEEELKFSDRLINANFSNYSSWHYRSSLLPSLFPDTEKQLIVDRQTLYNEYRKLENAFFTDPEDQNDIDSVHLLGLMFDFTPCKYNRIAVSYLSVTFDRAIKLTRISDFVVVKMKNGDQWTPFKNSEMVDNRTFRASNSYRFEIDDEIAECHLRPSLGEPYEIIDMEQGYVNFDQIYHIYHIKCKPVSEARRIIIEKLMDNCQELLNELKVEQKKEILKWPLLTYTFAILELEPIKMFSTILTNLEELATNVDPQRCEMYEEMVMNLRINEKLRQKIDNVQRIDILFRKVDGHFVGKMKLDNLGLKSIDHLKYLSSFITRLDLTGNKLTNLCIFEPFRRLTHLRLFNNPITSFKGISMLPQLDYLSVIEMAMNDLDIKDDFALKKIRMLEFEESGQSVKM
uniref:Geranylgeranyl transferase type-2 subunit alpha n=1 Tax=Wuchereria bancrofti TaxID=6293 RepID=A0A1I8EZ69_WUCBA